MDLLPVNYPAPGYMVSRNGSEISDFVIHHTAGALTQTPLDIDAEHRSIGDAMIAYNAVVTPDGKTYAGRPPLYVGAATFGRNRQAWAVVLVGNFQEGDPGYTGPPTGAQMTALYQLALHIHRIYPIVRTYGHGDVAALFYGGDSNYATACPGSRLRAEIPLLCRHIAQNMTVH